MRRSSCICMGVLLGLGSVDCDSSGGIAKTGQASAMGGAAGGGVNGAGGTGGLAIGAAGMGPGMKGPGMKGPGMMGPGMGEAGEPAIVSCTPGVQGTLVTGCGYPTSSGSALASVVFNESDILRAIQPAGGAPDGIVRLFYNDEHALTLGVRSVVVKTASGTTTTDFPVSPLPADPGAVMSPQTGTNQLIGDESGLDASLRPMWPVLFITDITANAQSRAGDWQQGGVPINPNAVFGTWKAAVRTVDKTVTPNTVTITPDADPAKNDWSLSTGDTAPTGLGNEGFGAEARWSVALVASHSYRLQVIIHDGDQNKAGGDSGEACVLFCSGGSSTGSGGSGGGGEPSPACPQSLKSCASSDGIEPPSCPQATVCANGCCLPIIP
jgi:hypothetical protein